MAPEMTEDSLLKSGDSHLGAWVYCKQHLRPHSTGWCTVHADEKIPLDAKTREEAYEETIARGLHIFGCAGPGT
jgi:hypothetical protein